MDTLFYAPTDPYYEFSNFYEPKIPFQFNHTWKNSEAYYQAQKWSSPDNNPDLVSKYQSLIAACDTPNKAFILGKAKFVHGNKNNWCINKTTKSLLDSSKKMTLNEAIALYTNTPIDSSWMNAKELESYKTSKPKLTFDSPWWESKKVDIMINIVWDKFTSPLHPELKTLLLSTTGDIREHTTRDLFWADGGVKGGGKNLLGQILVYTRNKLNNIIIPIDLNNIALPIGNIAKATSGSYVKLSDTLYYGIHPDIVEPDFKVDHYISLVEEHEFPLKSHYTSFPIQDRKAPTLDKLTEIVNYILSLKGTIYIFCKGGHGRSGTIACCVYGKLNNFSGKDAIKHINQEWHKQRDMSYIRPNIIKLGSPQTAIQKKMVNLYLK
jgi:predicted NAD-dependent protein-ADP-ribosyltransferase YbiA (DUF1768 family)